jgi:hypothetical protein
MVRKPQPRFVSDFRLEDTNGFVDALHQAETLRRNAKRAGVDRRQGVEVVIQVRDHETDEWEDAATFFASYWRDRNEGGVPIPTKADVAEVARRAGARFGRGIVRSTI